MRGQVYSSAGVCGSVNSDFLFNHGGVVTISSKLTESSTGISAAAQF